MLPSRTGQKQTSNNKFGSTSGGAAAAASINVSSSSWARSSRSSARYSSENDNDDEEEEDEEIEEVDGAHEDNYGENDGADELNREFEDEGIHHLQPNSRTGNADDTLSSKSRIVSSAGASEHVAANTEAVSTGGDGLSSSAASAATSANRVEELLPGGRRRIRYKNGTVKEVEADGGSRVTFLNGDTKTVSVTSGSVVYYYALADTTHTTFNDGLEIYEFPNKQVKYKYF